MASTTTQQQANQDIDTERGLLASGLGAAKATRNVQVPVIDLSKHSLDNDGNANLEEQLWQAATSVGFFTLVGHGISTELIEEAFATSAAFFGQDQHTKEQQSPFAPSLNSGYEYMTQLRPSTGTKDQKESLQVTAREGCMDGRWPSHPPHFKSLLVDKFMVEAHQLAQRILTLLERRACPHVAPGTIAASHRLWSHDGQCTLRLLHYPPMSQEDLERLSTPDDEGRVHWRAGPHTDWCNITLLFQKQAGLECCANPHDSDNSRGKEWTPVDPMEGGIAVNIGDMLSRWSDGRLYSNLHRVRMPDDASKSRYSIAFFAQSDKSTRLECEKPITAGDYILSRIRSNFSE